MMTQIDDMRAKLEARVTEQMVKLNELTEKAKSLASEGRAEAEKQAAQARQQLDQVTEQLGALKDAGEGTLKGAKDSVERSIGDVAQSIKNLISKVG